MKTVCLEPVEFFALCDEFYAVGLSYKAEGFPSPDELAEVLRSATVVPDIASNDISIHLSVDDSVWPKLCARVQWGCQDSEIEYLRPEFKGLDRYFLSLREKFSVTA